MQETLERLHHDIKELRSDTGRMVEAFNRVASALETLHADAEHLKGERKWLMKLIAEQKRVPVSVVFIIVLTLGLFTIADKVADRNIHTKWEIPGLKGSIQGNPNDQKAITIIPHTASPFKARGQKK